MKDLSISYGQFAKKYLETERVDLYEELNSSGKLEEYLINLDQQAIELEDRMIREYSEREGVNEELKRSNPLEWVQRLNNIKFQVRNFIQKELIFSI